MLPCGYDCKNKCSEECTEKCMKRVDEVLLCKHQQKIYCYEKLDLSSVICNSPCERILPCGHRCRGTCSKCEDGHIDCEVCLKEMNKRFEGISIRRKINDDILKKFGF